MAGSRERVRVAGRELTLTNLDKIIYPETGTTKADVLAYYAAVAHVLIPAAANRPATRKRWVNGVGTADKPGEDASHKPRVPGQMRCDRRDGRREFELEPKMEEEQAARKPSVVDTRRSLELNSREVVTMLPFGSVLRDRACRPLPRT